MVIKTGEVEIMFINPDPGLNINPGGHKYTQTLAAEKVDTLHSFFLNIPKGSPAPLGETKNKLY